MVKKASRKLDLIRKMLSKRVVFPIWSQKANVLAYQIRSITLTT